MCRKHSVQVSSCLKSQESQSAVILAGSMVLRDPPPCKVDAKIAWPDWRMLTKTCKSLLLFMRLTPCRPGAGKACTRLSSGCLVMHKYPYFSIRCSVRTMATLAQCMLLSSMPNSSWFTPMNEALHALIQLKASKTELPNHPNLHVDSTTLLV